MDIGAFVQENKRWLLGCLLGLVVFFIGRAVIGSIYDPAQPRRSTRSIVSSVPNPAYDREAEKLVREESRQLEAARDELTQEMSFVPSDEFKRDGKGLSPDQYLGKKGREVKLEILNAAGERDIEIQDGSRGLQWPSPTNVDQIRDVLFGLELLDQAAQRMFAAHDAVRELDPQAMGLVSMKLWLETRRPSRSARRRRNEPDPTEGFDSEKVSFELQCDAPVAQQFFELLRRPEQTLLIDGDLSMVEPRRLGDPLTVKGTLAGIAFREQEDT